MVGNNLYKIKFITSMILIIFAIFLALCTVISSAATVTIMVPQFPNDPTCNLSCGIQNCNVGWPMPYEKSCFCADCHWGESDAK